MKNKKIIFLIVANLFFVSSVFAQRIEISKEDFLQRYQLMKAKTESKSRRVKNIFEHWVIGSEHKFEPQESLIEFIPSDKIRVKSKFSNREIETIYIGETEYKKEKQIWEERKFVKSRIAEMLITLTPEKPGQVKWFLTENVNINGQFTNLIEWIFTEEFNFQNKITNLMESSKLNLEVRYWINNENLLIKSERIDSRNTPGSGNMRFLREYSYDNDIKIEAPIK